MSSLITIVRSKFLDAIRSVNPPGRWKILVVDDHSQKLLGSVLKQFDVLQENVTLIESIQNYREPQPQFEAVYLLMPTTQNVDRVIRDFSDGRKQYAGAHLFFIEGLPEPLFERLTSSQAEPSLKGLQELYVNLWTREAQLFSLNAPEMFYSIYSPPRSEHAFKSARARLEKDIQFMSKCITNLCITLNEYPFIRYYFPSHHQPLGALQPSAQTRAPPPPEGSGRWRTNLARGDAARAWEAAETEFVTKLLAVAVQQNLDDYKKANPEFPKVSDPPRPRATLIITDRAMDMMAPFIHEFTYQAMSNDLLAVEDGTKYTYKFQSSVGAYEDKTAILSDADSVWTEVRHMHMKEAIDKLMADFNKFMQDNAGFKGEGAASLNDMKDMLASLPQYQEQREKFSLHLNMAQECMSQFEREKLSLIANVEQNCATGLNAQGKTPKTLVEEMVPLLDSRDVTNSDKVRMVSLYIQYREGVPDEDRRRLYQHARLNMQDQDAVNSLVHLGVRINRTPNDKDIKRKIKHKPSQEDEYELSRFKPLLKTVIEDNVSDRLDQSVFPYVKDSPSTVPVSASSLRAPQPHSLRSAKPSWHKAARPGSTVETRQRLMVFVAGGVTYSEIREAYQLSTSLNRDIYIGSTHIINPRQFVDDLKVVELSGVGSKAIPNGLPNTAGPATYQEYYDEKYFTKDAPPPQPRAPASGTTNSLSVPKDGGKPGGKNASAISLGSVSTNTEKDEKKKKKKGLFHF